MGCKILLVYPNHKGNYMLPPGLAYLSANLKKYGHEVRLFDTTNYKNFGSDDIDVEDTKMDRLMVRPFTMPEGLERYHDDAHADFVEMVTSYKPDIIGLSATEDLFLQGISLLEKISHLDILTVAGGVFPTFAPEIAIGNPQIDIICRGDGEEAFPALCNRISEGRSFDDIHNLWIKKSDGTIIRNHIKMADIDKNHLIDLSIFDDSRFYRPMAGKVYRMLPVETFRGCPFNCTYCNSPSQTELYKKEQGKPYLRKKALDKVYRELTYFKDDMKCEYIYFWADNFLSWNNEDFNEFIRMYDSIRLPFWFQTRPENVEKTKFMKLKEAGCHRISFGIEHGNEKFRETVLKRKVKNQTIIDNLNIVHEIGIPFSVNNIIGFPYETYELAQDTIELNRKIYADNRNAYPFTPFHGTPLRSICEELGYIKKDQLVQSLVTIGSPLDMPQFPKKKVDGLIRTFNLYVSLPEKYWPDIKKAEEFTHEGNEIYQSLKKEYYKIIYG